MTKILEGTVVGVGRVIRSKKVARPGRRERRDERLGYSSSRQGVVDTCKKWWDFLKRYHFECDFCP